MEIEAKFVIPDPGVYWHLQRTNRLAGYSVSTSQVINIQDTYMDTSGRRIQRAGYSCRQRETIDGITMTLKSLRKAEGAVHRREEWELMLKAGKPPKKWPKSKIRKRVLKIVGQEDLDELFELQQTRVIRLLIKKGQAFADFSLDSVSLISSDKAKVFFQLEAKPLPDTSDEIFTDIVACLQKEWNLKPEPLSKFERSLVYIESGK